MNRHLVYMLPCLCALLLVFIWVQLRMSPTDGAPEPEPARAILTLTEEECRQLTAAVDSATNARDARALNDLFDWEGLLLHVLKDPMFVLKITRGAKQVGQPPHTALGKSIVDAVAQGGSFKLLRLHRPRGQPRALYRLLYADGTLNYLDLILVRRGQKACIGDVFDFAYGEEYSRLLSRMIQPRDSQVETDHVRLRRQVALIRAARNDGRYREALTLYAALPLSLQKERMLLLDRIACAAELGEPEYSQAITTLREHYPGDLGTDMVLIEYFIAAKQYEDALAATDRLDSAVQDPYLMVVRARICIAEGEYEHARRLCEQAKEAEPDLWEAHEMHLRALARARRFAEATRALGVLCDRFEIVLEDLETDDEYADLVRSAEYRVWKAARTKDAQGVRPSAR